ncbi:MAG TPA: glycosyltransferase family 39 protein [Thermoanaerobaculia bacterium]|nr:glycosyltransferase family 39 protein [Thermoanaerobaculia bacterium]
MEDAVAGDLLVPAQTRTRSVAVVAALSAVLLIAAALRLWGLFHDLPFSFFGDELHFMKRAAALGTGDLNPHWFHKPAFLMYILAGVDGLYFVVGRLAGRFDSTAAFGAHFLTDPGPFLLLGRMVVFLCGLATVFVVWRIARRVFGTVAAAFSAGLVAAVLAPMIASSQVIKSDVPAGLLMALSVLIYLRTRDDGRWRWLVVASLLAGAAMGTHYYGIVLVPTYSCLELFSPLSRWMGWRMGEGGLRVGGVAGWGRAIVRAAAVPLFFLLGFFLTSPYNFLDPTWPRSIAAQLQRTFFPEPGHVSFEPDSKTEFKTGTKEAWGGASLAFLRLMTSPKSMGLALTLLAAIGLVETLRRRETRWYGFLVLIPLSFFFLAAITVAAYHAQPRHLNAIFPLLATVVWPGALLLARLVPAARRQPRLAAGLAVGLIALASIPSFLEAAETNQKITRRDSRLVSYTWILANLPADARILVDDYGPILQPDRASLERQGAVLATIKEGPFTRHQGTRLDLLRRYPPREGRNIDELGHQWWLPDEKTDEELRSDDRDLDMGNPIVSRRPRTLAAYRAEGVRYVVTNSEAQAHYFDPRRGRAATFPSFARFYRELGALRPLKTFDPESWGGKGPVIWIYDLGSANAADLRTAR